jgi:hypothetical protein
MMQAVDWGTFQNQPPVFLPGRIEVNKGRSNLRCAFPFVHL